MVSGIASGYSDRSGCGLEDHLQIAFRNVAGVEDRERSRGEIEMHAALLHVDGYAGYGYVGISQLDLPILLVPEFWQLRHEVFSR